MRVALPLLALLLALLVPAPTSSAVIVHGGVFVDSANRVYSAEAHWEGPCDGAGTLHVTIWLDEGAQSYDVPGTSLMIPASCWAPSFPRCVDCPPVFFPFTWIIQSDAGGAHFVGGGVAYYERYGYWPGAWSMQGPFLDGTLEFWGLLDD